MCRFMRPSPCGPFCWPTRIAGLHSAHLQDSPNAKRAEPFGLPLCNLIDLDRSAGSVLLVDFARVTADDAQATVAITTVRNVVVRSSVGSGLCLA